MRALGTIVLAIVLSGFLAGMFQLQLAAWFNAQEEFIAVMFGQMLFVLIAAGMFAVAAVIHTTTRAVDRVALGLAGVMILGVVGVEAYAAIALNNRIGIAEMLAEDGPIVLEVIGPALLAVLIQWWIVRRHVKKRQDLEAAA